MSSRVFVDTLFVVAQINQRDQYHVKAAELALEFEGYPLLVTDAVLLEIGNALAKSYREEAAAVIENFLTSREVKIVRLTPELFDLAFAEYKKHRDKEWGMIDCTSFIVMRQENVHQALTFDHHFEQAGFEVLMR